MVQYSVISTTLLNTNIEFKNNFILENKQNYKKNKTYFCNLRLFYMAKTEIIK